MNEMPPYEPPTWTWPDAYDDYFDEPDDGVCDVCHCDPCERTGVSASHACRIVKGGGLS